MQIAIRADASLDIGSGHIMRCLALAEILKSQGHLVIFYCQTLPGNLITRIHERGFTTRGIDTPASEENLLTGYGSWLTRTQSEDAAAFCVQAKDVELVVVDHYALDQNWERQIQQQLSVPVLAIDDLKRLHSANIILDQTLGRSQSEYDAQGVALCGSQYALLSQAFANAREHAFERALSNHPIRVLMSFGGVDQHNMTGSALNSLVSCQNLEITVLLPPYAPHYHEIKSLADSLANVTHIPFSDQMDALMLSHDMAIGAPGTTSWERACLGLPSIMIPIAENQLDVCEQLCRHNIALMLKGKDIHKLPEAVMQLGNDWQGFHKRGMAICDGLGGYRVAAEINQLEALSQGMDSYHLALAQPQDAQRIYQWQCHPKTRQHALNPDIPDWSTHEAWFQRKLAQADAYFYLIKDSHEALGAVRLDRLHPFHYLVSIYVSPDHYRKGVASKGLALLDLIHPHIHIHATVLLDNLASHALFTKAGYDKIDSEHYVRPPINGAQL